MALPLMPKATAVWLVDNSTLTFEQIADFCGMHPLEIKGIADGEVAQGIVGMDPVQNGQLARAEIDRAEGDPKYRMQITKPSIELPRQKTGARYTPVAKRSDKPNAVAWLLKNHPEISDSQVIKLIGTTKKTINDIRTRSHWNMTNIKPVDPVSAGLCSQIDLDEAVAQAQREKERAIRRAERESLEKARAHGSPLAAIGVTEAAPQDLTPDEDEPA